MRAPMQGGQKAALRAMPMHHMGLVRSDASADRAQNGNVARVRIAPHGKAVKAEFKLRRECAAINSSE